MNWFQNQPLEFVKAGVMISTVSQEEADEMAKTLNGILKAQQPGAIPVAKAVPLPKCEHSPS